MRLEQQFDGVDVFFVDGVKQSVSELHSSTEQQLYHLDVFVINRDQQRRPVTVVVSVFVVLVK